MTTLREAAQMALDALEAEAIPTTYWEQTITALRAALAQPKQEPVAWWHDRGGVVDLNVSGHGTPLYFAPPQRERILCGCGDQIMPDDGAECGTCVTARNATQREWQGLADEELRSMCKQTWVFDTIKQWAKIIEAKLREKNS